MDSAPGSQALSPSTRSRFIERAHAADDLTRASLWWGAGTTLVVLALWHLPVTHAATGLRALLAGWWASWALFAVSIRRGPTSTLARHAELATEVVAAWASVAAVYATGTLVTAVWLVSFARNFAWGPRRRSALLAVRVGTVTAHLALVGLLAVEGRWSGAAIVLALLVGQILVLEVSSQLVRQRLELDAESEALHEEMASLEVRRENDRIARELHDGLGAELVALMLALRAKGSALEPHTQRVVHMLEELRTAVWSLRGGRGTLSEFEKLVRARARMTLSTAEVDSSSDARHRSRIVEPELALALLTAVQAVLNRAVDLALNRLVISLEAEPELAVTLRFPHEPQAAVARLTAAPGLDHRSVSSVDGGTALRIVAG